MLHVRVDSESLGYRVYPQNEDAVFGCGTTYWESPITKITYIPKITHAMWWSRKHPTLISVGELLPKLYLLECGVHQFSPDATSSISLVNRIWVAQIESGQLGCEGVICWLVPFDNLCVSCIMIFSICIQDLLFISFGDLLHWLIHLFPYVVVMTWSQSCEL